MNVNWRMVTRLIGAGVLALGLLWLAGDLRLTGGGTQYRASALGERWHQWDAPSLNLLQAIVERYLLPQLWSHVLLPLLLAPGWMIAMTFGAVIVALSVKPKEKP